MFTVALLTVVKHWKQPTYPPNDEWINIMWYIYTVECSLAIRRNEARVRATTHMKLENIVKEDKHKNHILYDIIFALTTLITEKS